LLLSAVHDYWRTFLGAVSWLRLGLRDLIVVETPDALLICRETAPRPFAKIVKRLESKTKELFVGAAF